MNKVREQAEQKPGSELPKQQDQGLEARACLTCFRVSPGGAKSREVEGMRAERQQEAGPQGFVQPG